MASPIDALGIAPPVVIFEPDIGDLDDEEEFLRLLIDCHLEDVQELERLSKGKGRQDDTDDSAFALRAYSEELELLQQRILDSPKAAMLRSQRDHQIALALSEGRPIRPDDSPVSSSSVPSRPPASVPASSSVSSLLRPLNMDRNDNLPGPSSRAIFVPKISAQSTSRTYECVICQSSVLEHLAVKVPCGHYYDFECLTDLFVRATTDESLMPARCCKQNISLDLVRPHLSHEQAADYVAKEQEHSTADRLYCPEPRCSAFLGAAGSSRGVVTCNRCRARVCAGCKSFEHPFGTCHPDTGDETLLELARQEGYQRCPSCRRFTELAVGCYHMTCTCRAQFCYLCGETWKRCRCPQWDEARLINRAEEQVQRQYGQPARPADAGLFLARVRQAADMLRDNHDCAHPGWSYRSGGGNCEHCGNYLAMYLLRCRQCRMHACVRCTRNRL